MLTINDLLEKAKGKEFIYNKIANKVYADLGIESAEVTLTILYVVSELYNDPQIKEVLSNDKKTSNT